ncbi:TrkA family potassium uptake protein [Lentilactobacillus sp. Marseille-Q4993]|uniref:potassium channel family protein n=1 Tax=Lentilactobacillus sp. Marseille-Q4993 TaxID=3039492 RepID=UPI0024BCDA2F|nr:TrkA family potassium uptake protein [Lentilactobacillus sp. Marseille-Q4993]
MKKNYAVIGLGRFGSNVLTTLIDHGQDVLAIDEKESAVEQCRDIATQAVVADAQNETALRQLDIGSFDNVFIAIATDIEASVMATMICKELGVKKVICKAENPRHAKVLKRLGADEVIQPERDMARRIALHTMDPKIIGDLKLSGTLSVAELKLTNDDIAEKSLSELDVTNKYGVTLIAVSRADNSDTFVAKNDTVLHDNDIITIIGNEEDVQAFEKLATKE